MSDKVAIFIDGQNSWYAARSLGFDLDYKRLLVDLDWGGPLLRAYYYTAVYERGDVSSVRPLLDWLSYNGYTVRERIQKQEQSEGQSKPNRDLAVQLTIDALELIRHIGRMYLFSGDGGFCPLVSAMQRRGVHVTVVSTLAARPPMISDELRRCADRFLELSDLRESLARRRPLHPVGAI